MGKVIDRIKTAWKKIGNAITFKRVLVSLCGGLFILFALTAGKIWFAVQIFSWYTELFSSEFGLDLALARAAAIGLTAMTLALLPSFMMFTVFGRRKKVVLVTVSICLAAFFLISYQGMSNVLVDRKTGKPVKCYIKTLDGFKFSNTEDFDPQTGVKYKPITPEVIKEYEFWSRSGKHNVIPEVEPGKYFDMFTGEPIAWYSVRPKEIVLFGLPGFDPMFGNPLKPIEKVIVEALEEKEKARALIEEQKMFDLMKHEQIDLDWYFRVRDNAYRLKSQPVECTQWEQHWFSKPTPLFNFYVLAEKIVFLKDLILVGFCVYGASGTIELYEPYLVDINGTSYRARSRLGCGKDIFSKLTISLVPGEKKRFVVVFNRLELERINGGSIYIEGIRKLEIDKATSPILSKN